MEFVFIWIVCGILAAVIGSSKGDGGFGWFIIGVILGPIGVIFSFFAKSNEKKELELAEEGRSSELKICEMCAEAVKAQAKICKHCGHKFSEKEPVAEPQKNETTEEPIDYVKTGIVLGGLALLAVLAIAFGS